jgi:parallel beta-helix repeat protein
MTNKIHYKQLDPTSLDNVFATDEQLNEKINVVSNNEIYVEDFPRLATEISDSNRINRAIASSPPNSKIRFANKTYEISGGPVILLSKRTYEGSGRGTIFKQGDGANLTQLFEFEDYTTTNDEVTIRDFTVDGNKANNTSGHGMYLFAMCFSNIENVKFINCPETGLYFDGNANLMGSTVQIQNCNGYSNGNYGIYLGIYNQDMHVYGGDIGLTGNEGIYLASPSSSIRLTTVWACQNNKSGIYVHSNATGSQIMNCQVEGNSGHGIEVHASHIFISGNKIYDNANVPSNYGLYDGISVIGSDTNTIANVTITGNFILSGLYNETGYHRNSIRMNEYHENCYVYANAVKFIGNGSIDETRENVFGLNSTDLSDHNWYKPNMVNVEHFGAKGDGVTDDTASINNAIDSLPNGGIVLIPAGKTYIIEGWADGTMPDMPTGGIQLKDNITLIMSGATLKLKPSNKDSHACITIAKANNVKITGGTLIGERYQHTNESADGFGQWGYGVAVVGSNDVYIENVVAKDFFGDGFFIGALTENEINYVPSNINIQKCVGSNNRRQGLSITSCYGGNITENTFKQTNGMSPEAGIDVEPNPGRYVANMNISNNRCIENHGSGLLFASIQADTISGKNCVVKGNHCLYNGINGIHVNNAHGNNFSDNMCHDNDTNGIFVQNSTKNTFDGNQANQNKYYGMLIGDSIDNTFSNNTCIENSQLTDLTYDNINMYGASSSRNFLQNNKVRVGGMTNKPRYGIYVDIDTSANVITNNDVAEGGAQASMNNASLTNSMGAGNKCSAPTLWTNEVFII